MTLIIDVPGMTTATTNPVFDVSATEQAIADIAAVATNAAWWNPDPSYINFLSPLTWFDCLNSYRATAKYPNYPATSEATGMASQSDVRFGPALASQNGQMSSQAGVELGFAGSKDYSLACVFQVVPGPAGVNLLGSGSDSGPNAVLAVNGGNGSVRLYHQSSLIASASDKDYRDGLPHLVVVSYDYAAKQMALRIDGVQKALTTVTTEVAVDPQNQRLVIGGAGATQSMTGALVGQIGDVFSFTGVALHKAGFATQLAALESRRAKYGIA
jgi:hypothetical protein